MQHQRAGLPLLAVSLAVFAWGFGPALREGHRRLGADHRALARHHRHRRSRCAFAYLVGGRITLRARAWSRSPPACASRSASSSGSRRSSETSIVNATLIPALQPVLILLLATRMFGERRTGVELAYAGAGARRAWSWWSPARAPTARRSRATARRRSTCWCSPATSCWASGRATPTCTRGRSWPQCSWARASWSCRGRCSPPHDLDAIHGTDWLLLLGLILFPGMVGHGLMTWAHHYVDVTVTSMMTLANPVVSIVGAWILYDQDARRRAGRRRRRGAGRARRHPPPAARRTRPRRRSRPHRRPPRRIRVAVAGYVGDAGYRRSMMVTLAWPPPSHIVCRP